jgi:hypothetical protein
MRFLKYILEYLAVLSSVVCVVECRIHPRISVNDLLPALAIIRRNCIVSQSGSRIPNFSVGTIER